MFTCARLIDGSLWCWGYGLLGNETLVHKSPAQVSALGNQVAEVSVGRGHTCARLLDGSLRCWGDNQRGQLGDGIVLFSEIPSQIPIQCP